MGLATALALANTGRNVTVLDCAIPPIDKACGEGLMPDSLTALANLGVDVRGVGMPMRGIRFLSGNASVAAEFPNGPGQSVRRVVLHQELMDAANRAGIRMLWGTKNVHTRQGVVSFHGGQVATPLIVGADGQRSSVRRDAGLEAFVSEKRRFAFRQHFWVKQWSEYVEVYWGDHFQLYVTAVAANQVCVALISNGPHLRLEAAISMIPALSKRLAGAAWASPERGALTISRKLRRVYSEGYALVGDASGSVDAITGEGMCMGFKQAAALARAVEAGDMGLYQREHPKICAKPRQVAELLLLLDQNRTLQKKALLGLAAYPHIFRSLLAAHVGAKPFADLLSWQLLAFGFGVLRA